MSVTRMTRRQMLKLAGLGAVGAAGGMLAACAPAQPAPTAAPAQTQGGATAPQAGAAYEQGEMKILLCCSGQDEMDLRAKWNAEFEQKYPGVKIIQEAPPAGTGYFEKLQTLIAAGTPPDLFDMWEGYVQPYASNGALLDLEPFIAGDPKIKRSDIVPAAIVAGAWQDKIHAMLFGFMPGPVSLYYNPDHFAKAGVDLPSPDWKWDDVLNAAKKLTVDADGDGVPEQWGFSYGNWFVNHLYTVWSNGGDWFTPDSSKSTLTDPKTVEALQYWADLINVHKVSPGSSAMQALQNNNEAFKAGALSMYLGNYWDVGDFKNISSFDWKAVLTPSANNGNRVWYMHTASWSISPPSKMKNAAWEYIREFVLDSVIESLVPYVPPLSTMLDRFFDVPLHKELGYEPLRSLVTKPDTIRIPGAGEKFDKIQGMIQAEIDLVMNGQKTALEAMEAATPLVDAELARR